MMTTSVRSKQLFCLTGGFLLLPMIRALSPPLESSQVLSSQQRRSLVLGTISTWAAAAPALLTAANHRNPIKAVAGTDARVNVNRIASPTMLSTVDDVVQWIDTQCDKKFLHAVIACEYRFLYRGEDVTEQPRILAPPPDLLLPGTYGTSEALTYFRTLEDIMKDEPVRPGNGHLATTSIIDAAVWGPAVSVWPAAGVDQHDAGLAWLRDGGSFYPPRTPQQDDRNAVMASLVKIGKNCHEEQSLDDVLSHPHAEVMFSATEFLAVPARWDDLLRSRLRSAFLI